MMMSRLRAALWIWDPSGGVCQVPWGRGKIGARVDHFCAWKILFCRCWLVGRHSTRIHLPKGGIRNLSLKGLKHNFKFLKYFLKMFIYIKRIFHEMICIVFIWQLLACKPCWSVHAPRTHTHDQDFHIDIIHANLFPIDYLQPQSHRMHFCLEDVTGHNYDFTGLNIKGGSPLSRVPGSIVFKVYIFFLVRSTD